MPATHTDLPEGVEIDYVAYLVNPTTGIEAAFRLGGCRKLADLEGVQELTDTALRMCRLGDDARLMTADEVSAYKASADADTATTEEETV